MEMVCVKQEFLYLKQRFPPSIIVGKEVLFLFLPGLGTDFS